MCSSRKLFLIPFLVVLVFNTKGQILKVDKAYIDADSSGYFLGNLGASLNINNRSATAEEEITYVGTNFFSDAVYVAERNAYILIDKINYFKTTGGPLISNGYVHFRVNFERKKKLSYETFVQGQYDEGRSMTSRYLAGVGLRLSLVKRPKSRLHAGLGVMQEYEDWRSLENSELIEKDLTKMSSYLGGNLFFSNDVKLHIVAYYQVGSDKEDEVIRNRVSGDTQLSIHLAHKLNLVLSFTCQYEDKPIIPINGFVYTVTNGLKWSF